MNMKFVKIVISAGLLALFAIPAYSQNIVSVSDSAAVSIKIEELKRKKDMLEKQIKAEDAKRNQSIAGIAPQTQERLNDRQDSVCLEIRSALLSVELELSELAPDKTFEIIAGQLEEMRQNSNNN